MAKKVSAPNHTQIPNVLLGDILPGNRVSPGLMADLEGSELKVYLAVCRLTFGFHQEQRRASLTMIQDMTGLSRQGVVDAAKSLEEKHKLIERSLDGGVTLWKVVVNSVDQEEENLCQSGVNSVDQLVNSVDQWSLPSRPPSKKETKKKPEKEGVDYLSDLINPKSPLPTGDNPADQWLIYRDEFMNIHVEMFGERPDPVEREAIAEIAGQAGADSGRWRQSYREAKLNWTGRSKNPPLARVIEYYNCNGSHEEWRHWKYPDSNGSGGNDFSGKAELKITGSIEKGFNL